MTWTLANKVAAALVAMLICLMAATGFFAYLKLEDILSSMVRSRYGVVVDAIRRNVEDRLALGIPLYQQRDIQALLEVYKADDPQILEIQAFNIQGDVLFDSDRGAIGSRVPTQWPKLLSETAKIFADQDADGRIVGAPIMGAFGQMAGAVVVRYPSGYLEQRLGALIRHLMIQAGILTVLGGLAAWVGSRLLLRPLTTQLSEMSDLVTKRLSDAQQDPPDFPDFLDHSLEGAFKGFEWNLSEAKTHLTEAMAEVERLDRMG